jgi:hypothetical protein
MQTSEETSGCKLPLVTEVTLETFSLQYKCCPEYAFIFGDIAAVQESIAQANSGDQIC